MKALTSRLGRDLRDVLLREEERRLRVAHLVRFSSILDAMSDVRSSETVSKYFEFSHPVTHNTNKSQSSRGPLALLARSSPLTSSHSHVLLCCDCYSCL